MDKNELLKKYLERGADIAGGIAGGAIGLFGPVGAVIGGGLGVVITHGLKDVVNRQLSNRQEVRVAASTAYMITGISNKLQEGNLIRGDNFFESINNRSSAEELFEGVLLKCKDQYQEKKIAYTSKIFEKTIFDSSISSETANHILSLIESITYRKLCIIAFVGRKNSFNTDLLMKEVYSAYNHAQYSIELEILKQDIYSLINVGILIQRITLFTKNEVVPSLLELSVIGNLLFTITDLNEIPNDDISPIYEELLYKEEFGFNGSGKRNPAYHL